MYEVNVNCSMLKEYLVFLVKQDLVEERTFGERRVKYAITQKGMNVLNYFKELQCALPITEEPIDGDPLPL
jgi:predicted transcriptional regulator